jgi:hypothetical protein
MSRRALSSLALALAFALTPAVGFATPQEETARLTLTELRLLVSEGTAVIGDLQPMINSGKVDAAQTTPQALEARLRERYQKAAGRGLDGQLSGLPAQTRTAYLTAYRDVLNKYRVVLARGGQDAFVPAYFRALVLREFNRNMEGKVRAYATNRDDELINGDWAVSRVMKGSPLAGEVTSLMATGGLDPVVRRSGDRMLGYWPMKLGVSCVQCHAANGLKQKEGAFGGALVAELPLR